MTIYFIGYFSIALVFFALDLIWLKFIAFNFYQNQIGSLLLENPKMVVAGCFYLTFIFGILIFAVLPSVEKNSMLHSIILGALFGFFTYATYDLTNLATLKDWSIKVAILDIIWGSFLVSLSSLAGFLSINYFINR